MNIWVKRTIWIAIGAGLLFLGGNRIIELQQKQAVVTASKKKRKGGRTVSVEVTEARRGSLREDLVLTGALKPKEQVDITAKATGRVVKIHFYVGDRVKAGELVAELEDDELQQQVKRAAASIGVTRALSSQREAERENAGAELDRAQKLLDDELISAQDYASVKTNLAVVEAQVELARAQTEQAEAELRELKIRLEQAKILAPLSGFVAIRYVDEGALVSPTTPILRVVNLSTMVTQANVPERNMGRLRVGNQAEIRVDALPDEVFQGRIARIAPVLDAATRSALIEIDVPNPNDFLKAEMFVRIRIDTGLMREATLIPREGLVYRGQQAGVYVVEQDRPVFRAIETGLTRQDYVEVLANLEPGAAIVGRGATMLEDGDRIRVSGDGGAGGAKRPQSAPGNGAATKSGNGPRPKAGNSGT